MRDVSGDPSNLSTLEQKELLLSLLNERRRFPLSLAQQRIWLLNQIHPGNPAYNVTFGLRLHGDLDREALTSAARELMQRHEILRTRFETNAGYPLQIVTADSAIEIPVIDLTGVSVTDRPWEAHRIGIEEAQFPFDLATCPLLRMKLIRLDTDEHLLLCVMHHIVCDGWSLEIFVRELAALYHQHSGGPSASLADLPIQYGDYAQWQRKWVVGDLLADQTRYWKQALAGAPPFLDLLTDRSRPSEQTSDGASQVISIPRELVSSLADFGHARRSTLFMVMLAAYKALLHVHGGIKDILVGIPVAGRSRIELEDLIGFFVNTLVLRTDLSGDPDFNDLLLRVREVALDAFAHADLPFEKLVEELNPQRTLSYSPVIQVMFSASRVRKPPDFGNLSASPYVFSNNKSLFDLSVEFIEDTEDRWWFRVEYDTALFDYARIAKMLKDYLLLLETVAVRPHMRLSNLTSLLKTGDSTVNGANMGGGYPQASRAAAPRRETSGFRSKNKCEPRDALEQILVRVWERVLGIPEIGTRDNFFDLGGHSLLAAQLVSETEKAIGRSIPVSTLFRGSTIESFADILRSGNEWSPDPLVMEINRGAHGFPLFAVVESGMDALGYGLMARHLDTARPFYKLQAHAPVSFIVPLTTAELRATARQYVSALRTIQPKGPYFLIGMCIGAHIAEQMVLELEARGHEVGLFAIIDTFVLQSSEIRWLMRLESFQRGRARIAKLPLWAQLSHYKHVVKKRLYRMFSPGSEPPPAPNPWWAKWPEREIQNQKFRAPVVLFRRPKQPFLKVPRQPFFKMRDHEMGWGSRSLSGVQISTVNTDEHNEMLREPAVRLLAEQLNEALRHIEESHSSHVRAAEPRSMAM
jgi:thioesterase domain-containing protein/acyl carrier protein